MIFDIVYYIVAILFGGWVLIAKLSGNWLGLGEFGKILVKIAAIYIIVVSILKLMALLEYF